VLAPEFLVTPDQANVTVDMAGGDTETWSVPMDRTRTLAVTADH